MKSSIIGFIAVSSLLAACGGGSSTGDDDDTPTPDGPVGPTGDGPAGACTADPSYNGTTATASAATFGCETAGCAITAADAVFVEATLNDNPDLISIELYNGFGVFTNGIVTGDFPLTGDEANYGTCGACVLIVGDDTDPYMATGGTLTITSLTPTVTGKLSNATFTHVTIDEKTATSTPVGDCDSASTGDFTFSETATEETE